MRQWIAAVWGLLALVLCATPSNAQPVAQPVQIHVTEQGLVADLYVPANSRGRRPALIILGGSEGGLGSAAAGDSRVLARHGYVTLHLAYFDAPGLPKDLGLIPLEYFNTAIDWLRRRPEVDPERIGIEGGSIGSEVALIVAANNPEIKVVVATMPTGIVWPGIVHTDGPPPSTFTFRGKPLPDLPYGYPFTSIYDLYAKGLLALDQHPDAIIPVEQIQGPIMLVCGKSDTLWPSCPMAEQVRDRLKAKHFQHRVELLEYADAGHAVFGARWTPDTPNMADWPKLGGTVEGNRAARQESWQRALDFVDNVLMAKRP